jgi:Leucine-rich repeat (LRR) protein
MRRALILLLFSVGLTQAADPTEWIRRAGGEATRNKQGQIVAVNLSESWVTDSDLAELSKIPTLTRLDLSMTRISDHGLQELKSAPAITDLNLRYAELITDAGLMTIKNWKHLKRLDLRGTKITDATLEYLSGVTSLQSLDIGFVQVTDNGLERLTPLEHLTELTLGGNKLSEVGLRALRQMPNLTYLDLGGAQRTDSGLWSVSLTENGAASIATLHNLRRLRLNGTMVSPRSLENLKGLAKLEELDLQECRQVSDTALTLFSALPALHVLDLTGTPVSAKGIAELRRAKPQCRIYSGPLPSRGTETSPA